MRNCLRSPLLCVFVMAGYFNLAQGGEMDHSDHADDSNHANHTNHAGSKDHANSSTSAIEAIFNWAENNYQEIFPSQQATQILESWRYRAYPTGSSGNVFIGAKDNEIYVQGGPWGADNPVFIDTVPNLLSQIFPKEHGFISNGCIITDFAKNNLPAEVLSDLDCEMRAWLNKDGSALKYKITISGMELINSNENTQDDIHGLHIHNHTSNPPENPKGPHVLNVFASPNFDDADVVIKPVQGIIEGIWSDIDENLSFGEPDNSHKLSGLLGELCNGKIFSAGHGAFEDAPGHRAPYIKMLLSPTPQGEQICKDLGFSGVN